MRVEDRAIPPPTTPERNVSHPTRPTQLGGGPPDVEALQQGYAIAIRTIGDYAPDVAPDGAQALGAELVRLSRSVPEAVSSDDYQRVQAGLSAALKAYQERAEARVAHMRQQVQAGKTAIAEFATGILTSSAAHRGGFQRELECLEKVAETEDLAHIRRTLGAACTGIRRSHDELLGTQQLVLLQLQDEIRLLHETIEVHKRQRERDPDTTVWRREHIDTEIRDRLARREVFSVLLVSIYNLKHLEAEYAPDVIHGLYQAFFGRLSGIVGDSNLIARWNPTAFAILLPGGAQAAEAVSEQVCARLPGCYAIQAGGRSYRLVMDLSATIMDPLQMPPDW